eukprot:4236232-Pyramimonas_sp.AAC.1
MRRPPREAWRERGASSPAAWEVSEGPWPPKGQSPAWQGPERRRGAAARSSWRTRSSGGTA